MSVGPTCDGMRIVREKYKQFLSDVTNFWVALSYLSYNCMLRPQIFSGS